MTPPITFPFFRFCQEEYGPVTEQKVPHDVPGD